MLHNKKKLTTMLILLPLICCAALLWLRPETEAPDGLVGDGVLDLSQRNGFRD